MSGALGLLRRVFGYDAFRGHQQAAVEAVAAGEDALVLMPTGAGKSICYQLPALLRPGAGVVVSPLIALMQDQVAALRQNGVRAAAWNSTLDGRERGRIEHALREGRLDLLYVAPERFAAPGFLDFLDGVEIALFAIDEAHCVSQWGHDFRPDYRRLAVLAERFPGVPRIALTATADEPTRADIARELRLEGARRFVSGFDRPNIRYVVKPRDGGPRQLLDFLKARPGQAGIVYAMTRARVEAAAAELRAADIPALAYHAGMDAAERAANQRRFVAEDDAVMVATVAFGMGIDKPDVRFVAHIDLPKSLEAYYQETGRAGRDGLPAEAWMIWGLQDVVRLRAFVDRSEASDAQKRIERARLDALVGYAEAATCRRRIMLGYFGDDSGRPCGNCDICLDPPEVHDGSEAARMLLSAIYRTGQRFGAAHIVDVLRGRETERTRRFGHHRLPTWGVGGELSAGEWRGVIRQLASTELIAVDSEGWGALRLGPDAGAVLRGERAVPLRRDPKPAPRPASGSARAGREAPEIGDREGFEALRQLRRRLASEQGVPPYVVFHDAVLAAMLARRPASLDEMMAVPGVGAAKLERYGPAFLDLLRELPRPPEGQAAARSASRSSSGS